MFPFHTHTQQYTQTHTHTHTHLHTHTEKDVHGDKPTRTLCKSMGKRFVKVNKKYTRTKSDVF